MEVGMNYTTTRQEAGRLEELIQQLRERESDQVSEVLKWIIERAAGLPPYWECVKAVEAALGPRLEEEAVKAAFSGWKRKVARDIVVAMPGTFLQFCKLYGGIDGYVGNMAKADGIDKFIQEYSNLMKI